MENAKRLLNDNKEAIAFSHAGLGTLVYHESSESVNAKIREAISTWDKPDGKCGSKNRCIERGHTD